jgi:hypothetical protein
MGSYRDDDLGAQVTLPEAGSVATWYYQDPAMKQHGPYTLPEVGAPRSFSWVGCVDWGSPTPCLSGSRN